MDNPIPRDPGPRGNSALSINKGGRGGKGKGPKGGKGKGPRHPNRIGGYGGFKGVNKHRLNQLIQAQLQAVINPLRDEKKDIRRQTKHQLESANTLYDRTNDDLSAIYDRTGNYIAGRNEETAQSWDKARGATAQSQQGLLSQLMGNSTAATGGANDEMARLGISGANTALAANVGDSEFAKNLANQQGANTQANLEMMASAAGSVGNLLMGMNQGSYASAAGQAANAHQDNISSIKNDSRDALAEVMDAIRGARGTRPGLFQQMLQQLQTTGWGMYVDQQNLNQNQQQINMQRQAQRFAQAQSRRANSGSSSGSSGSGGSSSGGSGGSSADYYSTNNDLLIGALTGKGPKGPKKPHRRGN